MNARVAARLRVPGSALGLFAATAVFAASLGGDLRISISEINAGGTISAGGNFLNRSAIGGRATPMSGGPFTLTPGPTGSLKAAPRTVELAHAYPSRFLPSQGHDRLTFSQVPAEATIQVFSISGKQIKVLRKNDSTDSLAWSPVADEAGRSLSSGIYLFHIRSADGTSRQGKFLVVR